MAPQPIHLDFHYDISCPFAYIASLRLPSLQHRHPTLQINYRPVLLGALYRATAAPQGAAGSASDTFNPTKRKVTSAAFPRTLARLGVAYREPPRHPLKTTRPLRLLYCVEGPDRVALTASLYRAYWVERRDVSDLSILKGIVENCDGLSPATKERLWSLLESGEFEGTEQRKALEQTTDLAVQRGAFGVPALWIQQEGRLYWGQDRLHFVEKALFALEKAQGGEEPVLEALIPRYAPVNQRRIPDGQEVKMEFWYDFSSPWAFLGWTQLARLQRTFGERLKIEMKPFLLGILFREIGAPNLPMAAVSEAKRKYSQLDHTDWTRWWNDINQQNGQPDKNIDFYWADIFPIRTPTVLRAVLVEPRLVETLFRACWERNQDMSSDDVLHSVIAEAGYDADKILEKANSPEIKQDLRRRTKEAKDTGICGVPSYRIFRRRAGQGEQDWKLASDIIWGQDEIVVVEDLIAGWDGKSRAVEAEGRGGRQTRNARL
ncbi:hypothetical protein H2200_005398 [Cladophialophora chaetospira]|uniref:DSBA-like thioredoxin domain-containing protein n=1 Tax=Cladophialophora chaetospira TaxID=386627 RepID=A0AA39CJT3_9EURO|nr:hypothetical protein H2200_005398 [Cladophialophora chaetospira]